MKAYGLKTHIWNNNLRCIVLLCLFPVLLLLLAYAGLLLFAGFGEGMSTQQGLVYAAQSMPSAAPVALGLSAGWFSVAFLGHQKMINMATKARGLSRREEPRAYLLLENLCISRGIVPAPKLMVIETEAMNAYASGISTKNYTITLTRGLMNNLDDAELEAVIAHELSHIKNNDVRLLIIAVIFVGIFSFIGEMIVRSTFRTNMPRTTRHRRSGEVNAAPLILIAFAIAAAAYLLAMLTRFALSRKREYMADAGAVELTKNPDAMISALRKISGRAQLTNVPADVREMAFENARTGFAGMFATHPPIEKRIDALIKYAGGRDYVPKPASRMHEASRSSRSNSAAGRRVFGRKPR